MNLQPVSSMEGVTRPRPPDGKMVRGTNNGEPSSPAAKVPSAGASAPSGEPSAMPSAVWAIDATTDAVVAKIPVGKDPVHVVVTTDGRFAYVTNGGANPVGR